MALDNGIEPSEVVRDLVNGAISGAVDKAKSYVPTTTGFAAIDNSETLKKARKKTDELAEQALEGASRATEQAQKSQKGQELQAQGKGMLDKFINWVRDLILEHWPWSTPNSIATRTALYATIGLNAKGDALGNNPFTDIDKTLGINIAAKLQTIAGKFIRDDIVGFTGVPKDPKDTYEASIAAHRAIAKEIHTALSAKYKDADQDALKSQASKAASAYSGIDPKIADATDAAEQLAKAAPTKGFAAMVAQSSTAGANVTKFTVNSAILTQTATELAAMQQTQASNAQKAATAAAEAAAAAAKPKTNLPAATDVKAPGAPCPTPGKNAADCKANGKS